jgi:hypothetical protein
MFISNDKKESDLNLLSSAQSDNIVKMKFGDLCTSPVQAECTRPSHPTDQKYICFLQFHENFQFVNWP